MRKELAPESPPPHYKAGPDLGWTLLGENLKAVHTDVVKLNGSVHGSVA